MIRKAASSAPGHIWNSQDIIDDAIFATRSLWETLESLRSFVYSGIHRRYLNRTAEWFVEADQVNMVLWRVADGDIPELNDAQARLAHLREHGPSERAFGFQDAHRFLDQGE